MMKIINCHFLWLFFMTTLARGQSEQEPCGTVMPGEEWERAFQQLVSAYERRSGEENTAADFYTVPVIFHVIHSGEPVGTFPNLSGEQIRSQITILNQDFSGQAYNAKDYPAGAFANWAAAQKLPASSLDQNGRVKIADFNIQFCLATKDTSGRILPEAGIDRINRLDKGWADPTGFPTQATMKSFLDSIVKPQSIWDATRYLNVWISDKSAALTYGGVSSVPPFTGLPGIPNTATETTDGIWCYAKVIGSYALFPAGKYISPFIDGRTMTHETGHYLGLRHIWGDAGCASDYCNDTPPAAGQNTGSPSYPWNAGSCSSPPNSPDGEMFMNFMDYTMGPSKYMFTSDQMKRAQTAMQYSPFRKYLGTHALCVSSAVKDETPDMTAPFAYPNPAEGSVKFLIPSQQIQSIRIFNLTGNCVLVTSETEIRISHLPPGPYLVKARTDNGMVFMNRLIKQ